MSNRIKKEINGVHRNISNGLRLLLFRRIELAEFYVSHDQSVILAVLLSGVVFISSLILSLPDPEFSVYGVATVVTQLFFLALSVYFFTMLSDKKEHALPLYIVLLSIWPLIHIIWFAIGGSPSLHYWDFNGDNKYTYIIFNIWIAAVVVSAVARTINVGDKSLFTILTIYVIVLAVPINYLVFGDFWYQSYDSEEEYNKYDSVNEESTYYRQFQLIENATTGLLPQRIGVSDIYFIGFGSYADQDVFMKEVQYAKKILDDKYDTKGRSITLINNIKTLQDTPLASRSNLNFVLDYIGNLLDPDEDILFLYLTSHGSKKHQLSVNQMPLSLNSIGPYDLKGALDESAIKYKVILVSACYSGGFVEPLIDDYTLIFTASAKNKKSFGCSNKSDFTYFGRSIFKDNIGNNYNLIEVFRKAIESIHIRENTEELDHSEPQLYIGNKIRQKISIIQDELKGYNNKNI